MKARSFFSALALAVVMLLLVGGAGAYWLAGQSPLSGKTIAAGMPSTAIFISQRSPIVTSFFGNPDRLISGSLTFTPPLQRRKAQIDLKRFQSRLLDGTHLNYGRDIQPWAGDEISGAVTTTDWDRDDANGQQPGYLVAIATDQPEKARQSLEKFWQKRAARGVLGVEQYLGVPIVYDSKSLASAVVGDRFVLFANQPKVLRDALTNAQAVELNLTANKAYQKVAESLPSDTLGLTVINLPQLAKELGSKALEEAISLNPPYDRLVITTQFHPEGLLSDATLLGTAVTVSNLIPGTNQKQSVDALKFIPENSAVAAAGTNVGQVLAQVETGLEGYGAIAQKLSQPLAKLEQQWGIDLSEDVLSWMPGEYALGMLPGINSPDWIFVTRQSPETTAGLEKLNAIAQRQGVSLGSVPLGEDKITAWTTLQTAPKPRAGTSKKGTELMTIQAKVEGVHATVKGYEIFATSLEAMELAIQAAEAPIAAGREVAIGALAPQNNGYLFIDGSALREWVSKSGISQKVQLLLEPVVSATLSNYGGDERGQRNGVFVQLKP